MATQKSTALPKPKGIGGLPSIFRNKKGGYRYQGICTPVGSKKFEAHRKTLAGIAKRKVSAVSDADVIEALSRGWDETIAYIKAFVLNDVHRPSSDDA